MDTYVLIAAAVVVVGLGIWLLGWYFKPGGEYDLSNFKAELASHGMPNDMIPPACLAELIKKVDAIAAASAAAKGSSAGAERAAAMKSVSALVVAWHRYGPLVGHVGHVQEICERHVTRPAIRSAVPPSPEPDASVPRKERA